MKRICVAYYSQSGHTRRLAEAAAAGVEEMEGATCQMVPVERVDAALLLAADGLIIASPEYFGYMAGGVKAMFDRSYETVHADLRMFRKPYTIVVSAGNDGQGARSSIERICRGCKLKLVFEPVVVVGEPGAAALARCREAGQTLAAGCVAGIY